MTNATALICSECGTGNYFPTDTDYDLFVCGCGHAVTRYDIELDEGETLYVESVDSPLFVVRAD